MRSFHKSVSTATKDQEEKKNTAVAKLEQFLLERRGARQPVDDLEEFERELHSCKRPVSPSPVHLGIGVVWHGNGYVLSAGAGCQRSGRISWMRFCGHPSASLRSTSVRYGRGGTSCCAQVRMRL